jgi:tRNA uridine 5-carboxymethylaminomethyl modification enzyme
MFDVLVVGGGHAGTEAAAAAARRGARVALLSYSKATIGTMSCNPSIGGVGKGHLVREVDALGGVMAVAADHAAIHHRMLNASKGRAVQGPRVQADRRLYAAAVQGALVSPLITMIEGEASDLVIDGGRVAGVRLGDGSLIGAKSVVLATGTFLGARLFRGDEREAGGRFGERAATQLGARLRELGLPIGRLKTGTPPRLDGRTVDWARLEMQPSDDDRWTMSPLTRGRSRPQLSCAITRTSARTHDMIRAATDRSPLFSGAIEGQGPRYCPSIEDKVRRFGDRDGHQLFLEPEGLDDRTIYPNGFSTSLPTDVQAAALRTVTGLERVEITTWGYAVEYDYLDPRSLDHRLALGAIPGLFCAGQINGTTGYEEAAAQGLVAGASAAAEVIGLDPLLLDRASSYIGVMIDDLVLQGVTEPYRMLTARAEYRLSLRADNAETRLSAIAAGHGLLEAPRSARMRERANAAAQVDAVFETALTASDLARRGVSVSQDGSRRSIREWLRFPGVDPIALAPDLATADQEILGELAEDARYQPYLVRQAEEAERLRADERVLIDPSLDYASVPGLSHEMAERLGRAQPRSLGAAARVRGVTPAALSALLLHGARSAA